MFGGLQALPGCLIMARAHLREAVPLILAGKLVKAADASGHMDTLAIGDFREMGWSRRVSELGHHYPDEMYYEWLGPNPIQIGNRVLKFGDTTKTT